MSTPSPRQTLATSPSERPRHQPPRAPAFKRPAAGARCYRRGLDALLGVLGETSTPGSASSPTS